MYVINALRMSLANSRMRFALKFSYENLDAYAYDLKFPYKNLGSSGCNPKFSYENLRVNLVIDRI